MSLLEGKEKGERRGREGKEEKENSRPMNAYELIHKPLENYAIILGQITMDLSRIALS